MKEVRALERERRNSILSINNDSMLSHDQKAAQIHTIMTKRNKKPENNAHICVSSQESIRKANPTYFVKDLDIMEESLRTSAKRVYGCSHYQRGCEIVANCCHKVFNCRFCHDESSTHLIDRTLTKLMICSYCETKQIAAKVCSNSKCGKLMASYYCEPCKLWDNSNSDIYHCDDCGICRKGLGLGIDYFHCQKCNVCLSINLRNNHKCVEGSLHSNCPICAEDMFTSRTVVTFLPCKFNTNSGGHALHRECQHQLLQTSYKCPLCLKSIARMSGFFRKIDLMLEESVMPIEYQNTMAVAYCNDCETETTTKYHFLYLSCQVCRGYNTKLVSTFERAN